MSPKVNINSEDQTIITCEQCEYKCRLNIMLKKHIQKEHPHMKHTCEQCEYGTNFIANIWEHSLSHHPKKSPQLKEIENENFIIKIVAEQNANIIAEIEKLKEDTKGAFLQLAKAIDDSIGSIREETNENCKNLVDKVSKLYDRISDRGVSSTRVHESPSTGITTKTSSPSSSKKKPKRKPAAPKSPNNTSGSTSSQSSKSSFNSKPKVLYAADSVGHTASAGQLEYSSNCRIKTVRAYSSVHDENAKWPQYNFTDVVKRALNNPGREEYDMLVMSAPTVDITNLNTSKLGPRDNTKVFQQKVIVSSQNMFSLAQRSLEQNPNLSKVIIMEHTPRFDKLESDPTCLKPTLARLGNSTLGQLWLNSPLKDKILIGHHSLESSVSGNIQAGRYVNQISGRSDGVHFYGPKGRGDYTNSVRSILGMAELKNYRAKPTPELGTAQSDNHSNCPQSKFQKKTKTHPSVVTQNRFSVFNQGN